MCNDAEVDRLWSALREMGERVTELEIRTSLLEDEEDVTLEDRDDDEDVEDFDDVDLDPHAQFVDVEWTDDDEEAYQARQEVTDESES